MDSILPRHIPMTSTNTFTHDFYGFMPLKIEEMSLNFSRGYGLGANFFYLLWELVDLKAFGLVPTKITAHLQMYNNYEFYNNCFYQNKELIQQWIDKDISEIYKMRYSMAKTVYGLGSSLNDLKSHLDNFNLIFKAYFNFKQFLYNRADMFIKEKNIDLDNTTFIWWRKSNKVTEVSNYPTYNDIKGYIINSDKMTNILQTDDVEVVKEFSALKNVKDLNILPIFDTSTCIDNVVQTNSPEQFKEIYNKDYTENIYDTFVLAIIASKCRRFIGYPGHMSQLVLFLRQDFNNINTFIFKCGKELF